MGDLSIFTQSKLTLHLDKEDKVIAIEIDKNILEKYNIPIGTPSQEAHVSCKKGFKDCIKEHIIDEAGIVIVGNYVLSKFTVDSINISSGYMPTLEKKIEELKPSPVEKTKGDKRNQILQTRAACCRSYIPYSPSYLVDPSCAFCAIMEDCYKSY